MRVVIFRFLRRLVISFLLAAFLLNLPGISLTHVSALTTVVDDFGPLTIPDPAAGQSCTNPLIRNIAVAANVTIADLNVRLNIGHIRRSDVRATLTSPAGTTVVLISGGGQGSPVSLIGPDNYDNYDVILDDTSVGSLYDNGDDFVAGAPDRTARPYELLSAFKGENTAGTWVMAICDTSNTITGNYFRTTLTFISASANTINGTVFIDYNQNGIRGAGDTGVSGIQVRAYNTAGAQIASANTNSAGGYSLSIPNGTQVRIEFTNIPANLRAGAFGRDSGTTVQFVTSPLWGVDLGLSSPDDYCQNNPFLVMPCYINGDPLAGGTAGSAEVMISIPNSAYGRTDGTVEQSLATGSQIGATWGLAYQRSTNTLFASAIAKRHAGFGPLGGGGIYAIVVDPLTGNSLSVTPFVDIDLFAGVDDGALDDTARNLPANSSDPNEDPSAWDAAGKQAIGDMDIGTNDDTLWLVNLADRTLYSLFIDIPATAPSAYTTATPISLPAGATACAASDVRPWAVEVYRDNVYVGVVCSAESTQDVNNLRAYILRTPEGAPGTWTLVHEFALNYPRGLASADGSGYPAEWRPWSSVFTSLCEAPCTPGLAFGNQIIYPQPILADIEFDTDGDMIIGLMDRLGHQTGEANFATSSAASVYTFYDFTTGYSTVPVTIAAGAVFEGTSAGDILRACVSGGGFVLESNASCGGITTGGAGNGQGPNSGEYYWQDMFVDEGFPASTVATSGTHHEVTLGGLVLFPGTDEVATAAFDPFAIRSGGITWFSNTTGTRTRAYEIFPQTDTPDRFGKAAGLGDIEGFCYQTPIEIGNRVWNDADGDGVQDAGEIPIAGVTVDLYQGGTLIASAVTDANGTYYFSSGPGTSTANQIYFLDDLDPNENYEIRIPNAQGGGQQAPLAGLALTTANVNSGANSDIRDSDASYSANDAVISITTGDLGNNDHTFDFGFTGGYSLGNRVWLDDGTGGGTANNGVQDGTEAGIANVVVNLYQDTDNNGVPDGVIFATTTTDASGYYRFDNLSSGGYIVEIPATSFTTGNPLFGLSSSAVDETDPNLNVDLNDNGIGTAPGVNGIRSGTVNLGPGAIEPTGETDPITNPLPGEASDDRSNRTVDFGFVPSYSLGNRVWFDTNNNALIDGGEQGIPGVRIELYQDNGLVPGVFDAGDTFLSFQTTDASGYYRFDNLLAGDYVVVIADDNFRNVGAGDTVPGDPLSGYWSSETTRALNGAVTDATLNDPDTDVDDSDDNGLTTFSGNVIDYVSSAAVTLGPGAIEPTGETDLSPTGQGATDDRADMTVDFGFYTMTLGNQVWADVNDDGLLGGEIGLNGVDLELLSGDGLTVLATTTTAGNGNYSFTGLPAGDYIVRIAAIEFIPGGTLEGTSSSSGGGTYEPAPDSDANTSENDDNGTTNGVLGAGGVIQTEIITLTPGAEGSSDNTTGTTNEPRVDLGVVTESYSLGNRVWFDTDNSSTRNAINEIGVPGVTVELYAASGGPALLTTTTDADGYYRFDNLPAGDYLVVLPASNFNTGGALVGYVSSGTTISNAGVISEVAAPDPDTNADDDDNGTRQAGGDVRSLTITLGPGTSEPMGEIDLSASGQGAADDHANMTVDFGFYRLQLGNLVFEDLDVDGSFSAGDTPIQNAVVQLFAANGITEINVGPDGILGTADDAAGGVSTGAAGTYQFSGLPQGNYIVRVTPPIGYLSTIDSFNQADNDDANTNADNNDNGDGILSGAVSSSVVSLIPGNAGALNNNIVTQASASTYNPTVDFGFVQQINASGLTKTLISSNQAFTTDPDVAIGEIATYRVTITIPTGTFTNARIVDTLERGLSFMDCTSITAPGLTTSVPGGFTNICANPTVDDAGGGTTTDVRRRVTFEFGTLSNAGAPQTLTLEYRAVVLDSGGNVSGVSLENSVVWSSDIGSIGPQTTTVTIVESDVSIVKTASSTVVAVGDVITITLTIDHTAASETNAYDLVITDALPVELDFVLGTLDCNAGVQFADVGTCQYNAGTRTVTGTWSNFALGGGNAVITFDVTVLAVPATNVGSVAWTSLPGIPPSPVGNPPGQQNANIFSTERGYDPGDPIDIYGVSSTLVLGAPPPGGGAGNGRGLLIPDTGFAPSVKTDMNGVPLETYSTFAESIWMEIPSLKVKSLIVGVPQRNRAWNVAWLSNQTGWLSGTAFPTLQGNSVVTGHVYLPSGLPGPFVNVSQLKFGDQVIIHFGGQKYIYEVHANRVTKPTDTSVFRHDEETWLTIITCAEYDQETATYLKRVIVRAVLVKVEADR